MPVIPALRRLTQGHYSELEARLLVHVEFQASLGDMNPTSAKTKALD